MTTSTFWWATSKLTKLRENRGWSKAELARQTSMNASTIGLLESRKQAAYPGQAEKIAKALGVEVDDIFKDMK